MRMDNNALKFDSQVMALAMPTESAFTKGAEGIGNVGKVFIEADKRKQDNALNALKMEEANQSIIGKKFENDTAQEKFDTTMGSLVAEKRAKIATAIKTENENKAEVKKLEEAGVMDSLKSVLPTTEFYNEGKIDTAKFDATRTAFLKDPKWVGKAHVVNAFFDSKLTDMTKMQEDVLKNKKVNAEGTKIEEEAKRVLPESIAKVKKDDSTTAQNIAETKVIPLKANAYAAKQYAGANLDNVNAGLAPKKLDLAETTEKRLGGKVDGKDIKDLTAKDRMKYATDPEAMEQLFPNYQNLGPQNRILVNQKFLKGIYPDAISEDTGGKADNNWRPTYQRKDLPPKPMPLPPLPKEPIAKVKKPDTKVSPDYLRYMEK